MAHISLSNFRKFISLDKLDLNDINIFVGRNNAGKSTVVKAIMLALDNIRDLRWKNIATDEGFNALHKAPQPLFRFDANDLHNLHIGTFDRAKCNFSDDKQIVFNLEYQGIEFEITVAGNIGEGLVSVPIQKIKITINDAVIYGIDYSTYSLSFELAINEKLVKNGFDRIDIYDIVDSIKEIKEDIDNAIQRGDALRVAQLQPEYDRLLKIQKSQSIEKVNKDFPVLTSATFDLTYFHENVGENILVQYLRTLLKISDSYVFTTSGTGEMMNVSKVLKKNTKAYKEEVERRQFIAENRDLINASADALETVLNNINVDYIQAHAATQKLILSTEERHDINSRVVHEYFQEGIQIGEKANRFLTKWLKTFGIAENIKIIPLDGEGYYVKVETDKNSVHLADMGMGSIQMIILLLRLVTIGNRISNGGQPWWVIIEEPEQNIHPMLQSLLADMFKDFQETFSSLLIIETHSEYLIRKTQLLMSEQKYSEDDNLSDWNISVYYFPSEIERQPYKMEYQNNGLFTNRFDSGFFDEAGRMHMEILKRSRNNKE